MAGCHAFPNSTTLQNTFWRDSCIKVLLACNFSGFSVNCLMIFFFWNGLNVFQGKNQFAYLQFIASGVCFYALLFSAVFFKIKNFFLFPIIYDPGLCFISLNVPSWLITSSSYLDYKGKL